MFEHTHLHTDRSLLDGVGTPEEYAQLASKHGNETLCVTDHGMMAAIPAQIRAAEKYNLKPVFGCEIYVNDLHHMVEDYSDLDDDMKTKVRKNGHLCLWSATREGYSNLVKTCSEGWINGFYYKPRASNQFVPGPSVAFDDLQRTNRQLGLKLRVTRKLRRHRKALRRIPGTTW